MKEFLERLEMVYRIGFADAMARLTKYPGIPHVEDIRKAIHKVMEGNLISVRMLDECLGDNHDECPEYTTDGMGDEIMCACHCHEGTLA